jgi:alanyl-tRNA synthetase
MRDTVAASVRLISVLPSELPAAIERLQGEAKDTRRQLKDLYGRLAAFEAGALAAAAETFGQLRMVVAALEGWDANGLKSIASAIAARPGHVAALVSMPPPSAIVIARASDANVDCAGALKAIVSQFGGKGGGRPELAQGGGVQGKADEIMKFARTMLTGPA